MYSILKTKLPGLVFLVLVLFLVNTSSLWAQNGDDESPPGGGMIASDPLAPVTFGDMVYHYFGLNDDLNNSPDLHALSLEGGIMALENLKVIPELHFWSSDISGDRESALESLRITGLWITNKKYFGGSNGNGNGNGSGYKYSLGLEWKKNLGERRDGTGTGTDILAPLAGISWLLNPTNTITFTLQYAHSYFEDDNAPLVRRTSPSILWIAQMPSHQAWFKLEDELTFDHENDESLNTLSLQLGKMFSAKYGMYIDALVQTGGEKEYDWGAGIGARMVF